MLKRVKRRYLAVQVSSASVVSSEEFLAAVWKIVEKLYGEYGASQTGLSLITFDGEKERAVLRALNSAVDMVRAALASVTKIGDTSVSLHVLRVSGTIRALYDGMNE